VAFPLAQAVNLNDETVALRDVFANGVTLVTLGQRQVAEVRPSGLESLAACFCGSSVAELVECLRTHQQAVDRFIRPYIHLHTHPFMSQPMVKAYLDIFSQAMRDKSAASWLKVRHRLR
jgi:hypothetical protein